MIGKNTALTLNKSNLKFYLYLPLRHGFRSNKVVGIIYEGVEGGYFYNEARRSKMYRVRSATCS